MKRLLREPLLHFLVLGGLFFGVHGLLQSETGDAQEIVVGAGQIERMAVTFTRTWQRPPSRDELKGLIDQYVREEIMSREAITLGLHQDDVLIRRHLQQKMEFIADDMAHMTEPTEAELAAWYAAHADAFFEGPRLTFRLVHLSPERHGERLPAYASRLMSALKKGADPSELGDPSLLPASFAGEPLSAVAASLGEEFAQAVAALPLGEWSGPIRSGIGAHLVLVDARTEGRLPPLEHVRPAVRRGWDEARRAETHRQFMAQLLERYHVVIAWPERG